MSRPLMALLTDFGTVDHYVGTMKGVALGICPELTLIDITHDIPPHDVRAGARQLAATLAKLLVADGSLLGFFNTSAEPGRAVYTKYVVVDRGTLRYRSFGGHQTRQRSLQNRDIIKLFETLRVSDSFLMKTNMREIIFRKPAYLAGL